MDIDDLRAVQSKERRKDSLQHLRDSFYDDVAAYIAARREERDERAAAVDSPFSDARVRKLSDEIETAEEVAESLYERRVGKVVKLASFAAADAPVDTDGMTTQELDLFEDLVGRIRSNKESVLDVLADGPGADAADAADGPPGAADAADPGATGGASAAPSASPDRTPTDADENRDGDGGVLADAMSGGASDDGEIEGGEDHPAPDGSPSAGAAADEAPGAAAERGGSGAADRDAAPDATVDPGSGSDAAPVASDAGETGAERTGADAPDDPSGDPSSDDPPSDDRSRGDPAAGGERDATDGRTTVRITRDVGRILGVDEREYDLESEDVVSLPAANAGPLVERDAAEPLE